MKKLFAAAAALCLLLAVGCGAEKKPEIPEGWQQVDFVWNREDGARLTLSTILPEEWDKDSINGNGGIYENFCYELYIDDKDQWKMAGSHGVVAVLEEGQTLQSVEIDAGYPLGCLSVEYVSIGDRTYRKENIPIDAKGSHMPAGTMAYANVYYFCVDEYLLDFFIYYSGQGISEEDYDHAQQETILSNLTVTFS